MLKITGKYILVPMKMILIFLRADRHQVGTVPVTPTSFPFGMTLYKITSAWNSFRHFVSLPQLAPKCLLSGTLCVGVSMRTTIWNKE